jgi:hypothetical protein
MSKVESTKAAVEAALERSLSMLRRLNREATLQIAGDQLNQHPDIDSRTRRHVMSLMGSVAFLSIERAIAAPADIFSSQQLPSEDVQLVKLVAEYEKVREALLLIEAKQDQLEQIYQDQKPKPLPELRVRKADLRLLRHTPLRHRLVNFQIGQYYTTADVSKLRRHTVKRERETPVAMDGTVFNLNNPSSAKEGIDYDLLITMEPWPLAQTRVNAIIAAADKWEADDRTFRNELFASIDRQLNDLYEHRCKICDAIAELQVFTIRGLGLKAKFAIEHLKDSEAVVSDSVVWSIVQNLADQPIS